ncbi:MAG: metallophosphoesterase [Ignisphaera sp.]
MAVLYRIYGDVYALADLPAIYIPKFKAVVIADVHLGFEEDMASKGVFLPRIQLSKTVDVIEKSLSYVDASILVIAGDIKHRFEKLGRKEARDLREFLEVSIKRFRKIVIVRGNHDTYLLTVCKKLGIDIYDALWLDDILVVHGHKDIRGKKGFSLVLMGHEHPSIALKDPVTGHSTKFPCFLLAPLKKGGYALVLPALGVYQSGTAISTHSESYLSPIMRGEADLENAKPFIIVEGEGIVELPRLKLIEDLMAFM